MTASVSSFGVRSSTFAWVTTTIDASRTTTMIVPAAHVHEDNTNTKPNNYNEQSLDNTTRVFFTWEGLDAMENFQDRFWKGNLFCETVAVTRANAHNSALPITLNVSLDVPNYFTEVKAVGEL